MAKQSKSAQIHEAFSARFRSAYLAEFGEHADAQTIHDSWEKIVAPVLEKTWPEYEKLNVSELLLFVKAAVHEAVRQAREQAQPT